MRKGSRRPGQSLKIHLIGRDAVALSAMCGQATEILVSRILANIAGSVTMAVFTVREVFGHLYVSALI
jgi:hypothetical protein